MDAVLHGLAIYVVLLLLFRLAGKRSLAQASMSDLLLLLVVGETLQQALEGRDYSLAVTAVVIVVLLVLSRVLDMVTSRQAGGSGAGPVILVDHGEPLHDRMGKARVTPEDVLSRAREFHGVEHMDQIQYAVLDKFGDIAIFPRPVEQ